VGEIYPSRELLGRLLAAGKPVTLSSDAHEPGQLGYRYDEAVELLTAAGVERICVWEGRMRREEPLG
jgi:histidinol-phosphatase (PHP family)